MRPCLGEGQSKSCRARLNVSLVRTQASLMFFNGNTWWNSMMESSWVLSWPTTLQRLQLSGRAGGPVPDAMLPFLERTLDHCSTGRLSTEGMVRPCALRLTGFFLTQ